MIFVQTDYLLNPPLDTGLSKCVFTNLLNQVHWCSNM